MYSIYNIYIFSLLFQTTRKKWLNQLYYYWNHIGVSAVFLEMPIQIKGTLLANLLYIIILR